MPRLFAITRSFDVGSSKVTEYLNLKLCRQQIEARHIESSRPNHILVAEAVSSRIQGKCLPREVRVVAGGYMALGSKGGATNKVKLGSGRCIHLETLV